MVLLPFALIGLIRIFLPISTGTRKNNPFWILAGVGIFIITVWLIIRTGSRCAFLSLCAGAIVVLVFQVRSWQARFAISSLLLTVLAWFIINEYTGLRVLDIRRAEGTIFSGRMIEWEAALSSMSGLEKVFGTGGITRDSLILGELVWGGYLSIYVTIYQAAGAIGLLLFARFIFSVMQHVLRIGSGVMPAASFITVALFFGIGEAAPIMPFNIQCFFFGFGVGLLPPKGHRNCQFKWSARYG